jgi:UDP-N-acetylmuramoylalanine--D-glutamate ligase
LVWQQLNLDKIKGIKVLEKLQQHKFLVVGSGITGSAVIKFLHKNNLSFAITDSRKSPPNLELINNSYPEITFHYGELVIPDDTSVIILSPGLALNTKELQQALKQGIQIWSEIELFAQVCAKPVVTITGANGKSTVTTLIADILRAGGYKVGVGGNLGTPALELLNEQSEIYVLELSSFQLETTYSLQSEVSILLNITPDHMDRYPTFDDYVAAKHRIFRNSKYKVYNRGDHYTKPQIIEDMAYSFDIDTVMNNYQAGVVDGYLQFAQTQIMKINDLPLLGEHNLKNVLAAIIAASLLQVDYAHQVHAIKNFNNLEHRCELIPVNNANHVWINDSKGTNVGATIAAIVGLEKMINGKWIIVLGGVGKDADFSALLAPIKQSCKLAILFGEAKHELAALLQGHIHYKIVNTLDEVIDTAYVNLHVNDGVLFSPACASLDMFLDYKDRGKQFKNLVHAKYQSEKVSGY